MDTCQSSSNPIAKWVDCGKGSIPQRAVIGGNDLSGENLYVGRASHNGEIIPGKINQSHGVCYIADIIDGKEYGKKNYQVLTYLDNDSKNVFEWIKSSHGVVPKNALQAGVSKNGERYFVGRVNHENSLVIGQIKPESRSLNIPYGGGAHSYQNYECLCVKQ